MSKHIQIISTDAARTVLLSGEIHGDFTAREIIEKLSRGRAVFRNTTVAAGHIAESHGEPEGEAESVPKHRKHR